MPPKQYFFNLPRGTEIEVDGWGFQYSWTPFVYHRCGPRNGKRMCWKRGVRGGPWFCRECEKQLPDEVYMLAELQKLKPKKAEDEERFWNFSQKVQFRFNQAQALSAKKMADEFDSLIKEAQNAYSKSK